MTTYTRRSWLRAAALGPVAGSLLRASGVTTIYVSVSGRDIWTGASAQSSTTDGPKATLAAARDALRSLPAGTPKRIVVTGGKYFVRETLVLNRRDSGLVIEAEPGEEAVLHGGRRLTGWRRDGDRFWSAPVGAGADFRMLLVNRRYCPRARLPEFGYFHHLSEFPVQWLSTTDGGWQRKPTAEELTTMRFRPQDLGPWLDPANAEIRVYHMWDESLVKVSSIDHAAGVMRFANESGHPPGAFGVDEYVVWNTRQGMTTPGQWYLDRAAGKVVYWPLPGENMEEAEAIVPTVESIVRIEGSQAEPVQDVAIRGLGFSVTNTPAVSGGFAAGRYDGAISVRYGDNCEFDGLTVGHVCGHGVKSTASRSLRIQECRVLSCGAGAMRIRGDSFRITDNRIHDLGLTYPSAIAVAVEGDKGLIAHNSIHHTPYSAVGARGDHHQINRNHIHHAMEELHDGAAIYVTFCRQVMMRGNRIHDIPDTGGYGSSAYYLDEQAERCLVEGNLSVDVTRPTHNHMASQNAIRNNLFLTSGDLRVSLQKSQDYVLERNILSAGGGIEVAEAHAITASADNIFWSRSRSLDGIPNNTLIASPGVENTGPGRYEFASYSPAPRLGIYPIDVSVAGCRDERFDKSNG